VSRAKSRAKICPKNFLMSKVSRVLLSFTLALLLVPVLPLSAFADELSEGNSSLNPENNSSNQEAELLENEEDNIALSELNDAAEPEAGLNEEEFTEEEQPEEDISLLATTSVSNATALRNAVKNAPNNTAHTIKLTANISLGTTTLDIPKGKNITLVSGHTGSTPYTLTNTSVDKTLLYIAPGANLTLDGVTITGSKGSWASAESAVNNAGTLTLKSGKIAGSGKNGVINYGSFTMLGGTISGNSLFGVSSVSGTFNMSGGTISDNAGTGVRNDEKATFTMSGGSKISNNKSGGVFNYGVFNMKNGTISGNTSSGNGGGVNNLGKFNMSGGTISGNNVSRYGSDAFGGGVYCGYNNTSFTMSGGTISGNTADLGGGAYCDRSSYDSFSSAFTMTGGTISGNTAKKDGGGVWIGDYKKLTVGKNATFSKNKAQAAYSRASKDDATYKAQIACTKWTSPFTQGYNNYDIAYTSGTKVVAPKITTTSLADGAIGKAYSKKLAATSGVAVTWTISSGSLPKGLKLASDGTISGTPTAVGTSTFTVKATNMAGSATKQLSIKVVTVPLKPTITTTSLAGGTVGKAYSQKLAATGDATIKWSLSSGSLPKGLKLAENGTISGTPTAAGTVTFTVKATNSVGSATKQLSIKIAAATKPTITTTSLAGGSMGKAYSQKLTASGDTPITWEVSAGALPKGLKLASNGTISGTPTVAGTATFTVKATNAGGNATKQLSIKIAAVAKPAITTTSLAGGTIAKAYSQKLAATGETPITWEVSAGSLPKGLKLASNGTISGTPTAAGTSTFTVKATNAGGSVTKELSIKIARGTVSVACSTHVQSVGWQAAAKDGAISGTSGRSLRLEGLKVNLTNTTGYAGGISYSTHIQSIGWQKAAEVTTTGTSATQAKGTLSGTEGRALRLEAMTMTLTGDLAKHYDIYYRVHAQNVGWMGWAKNGEPAGTAGHGFRLEALQVVLVAKNAAAPANTYKNATTPAGTPRMIDPKPAAGTTLGYSATVHIQSVGDKSYSSATNSTILGTSGKGLRLEAMTLKLKNAPYSGSIKYETHIQSIGWQAAKTNGALSGTSGQGLRLEALRISLTGDMGKNYDIYYRTHIQNIGWTGWAKNGQSCGSAGYGYRMEAMQIVIVPKGSVAPGINSSYFYQK